MLAVHAQNHDAFVGTLIQVSEVLNTRRSQRLFYNLYPDETILDPFTGEVVKTSEGIQLYSRKLYPKHMELFRAGKDYRERCFMAANRVGKTLGGGGFEITCHLTGDYPDWWEGRRFDHPVRAWAAGKTNETTRDIVQKTLLGDVIEGARKSVTATGVIPGERLGQLTWKQGVQNLIDTIKIRHVSGGWSVLGIKSYQQGRGSFEGTAQHFIWLDEEPPLNSYGECVMRTATTNGLIMLTFTPLEGHSETVMQFLPSER